MVSDGLPRVVCTSSLLAAAQTSVVIAICECRRMRWATFGGTPSATRSGLHVCRVFRSGITRRPARRARSANIRVRFPARSACRTWCANQAAAVLSEIPGRFAVVELLGMA